MYINCKTYRGRCPASSPSSPPPSSSCLFVMISFNCAIRNSSMDAYRHACGAGLFLKVSTEIDAGFIKKLTIAPSASSSSSTSSSYNQVNVLPHICKYGQKSNILPPPPPPPPPAAAALPLGRRKSASVASKKALTSVAYVNRRRQ